MPLEPPKSFSDIDLSLVANPVTKDIAELENEKAIGQSIRNILSTDNGERLFRPDLGAGIRQMLFEPMNAFTEAKMQTAIESAIEAQEPRVVVQSVGISADEDNYKYDIFIMCIVKNTQQEIEVVQTLTRGR